MPLAVPSRSGAFKLPVVTYKNVQPYGRKGEAICAIWHKIDPE